MLVKMKEQKKTHVYCVPGMAAGPAIFEYIKLPPQEFELHFLTWKIPTREETLQDYAQRMSTEVRHRDNDLVLLGVSFGGVVVQEMSKILPVKRLILISTVKTKYELSKRMKFAKKTGMYKVLPTGLAPYLGKLSKFPLGNFVKKRVTMYKKYMAVDDKTYLDWCLKQLLSWPQEKSLPHTVHIQGDKDLVFPIQNITDCIRVKNGTHVMIVNRFRWFNEHLPDLILNGRPKSGHSGK